MQEGGEGWVGLLMQYGDELGLQYEAFHSRVYRQNQKHFF